MLFWRGFRSSQNSKIEFSLNLESHFGSTWVAVHVFGLLWDAFLRFVQSLGTNLEVLDATWVQLGCNLVAWDRILRGFGLS